MEKTAFYPKKDIMMLSIDRSVLYGRLAVIHLVTGVFLSFIYLIMPFPDPTILFVLRVILLFAPILVGIIASLKNAKLKKQESNKLTDMSDSKIELKDEWLDIQQTTTSDTYEQIHIAYDDIMIIAEKTNGEPGLLLKFNPEGSSTVSVNYNICDINVCEIDGRLYRTKDFISFYDSLVNRVPDAQVYSSKKHKKWIPATNVQILFDNILPWLIVIIIMVADIILHNAMF